MNNLKSHILSNGIIEIMPITTNYNNNILPPPPKLRRSPRGVDCGITNPPYEKELKLKHEVEELENNILVKKWYFIDLTDKNKNMTWWMCPESLDITWEATHFINRSIIYKDVYNLDFSIIT